MATGVLSLSFPWDMMSDTSAEVGHVLPLGAEGKSALEGYQ